MTEVHSAADIDRLAEALAEVTHDPVLRRYHAARLGRAARDGAGPPGRRGFLVPAASDAVRASATPRT